MWLGREHRFNSRVPRCVLALPHWLSGREGGHFSHYCSPPAWHVKDGQNQYTYGNKDSGSTKSGPLIWSKTVSTCQSRTCMNALTMWAGRFASRLLYLEWVPSRTSSPPFLCLPIPLLSVAPQGTAGWVKGVSQSDCDKGTHIKFPDSYLNNLL